mgnify:CR=1 FL=1
MNVHTSLLSTLGGGLYMDAWLQNWIDELEEEYEKLMLRFALELSEVGVTENMGKLIADLCMSAPNRIGASAEEVVARFTYRHNGYLIEAKQTIELVIKTCK